MNPVEPVASQQAKDNIYETDELLHQYLGLPQNVFFSSLLLSATVDNVELSTFDTFFELSLFTPLYL